MARVHVVGAGMAGLACAVAVAEAGRAVRISEAAPHPGGRCRSFFDDTLERTIDNGNHLILGGNPATFAYLDTVGARHRLAGQARADFPFVDLRSGERWRLRPNAGRLPWWIFSPRRRVPGTRWTQYLAGLMLATAGTEATVAECLAGAGPLVEKLWQPLTVAVLNASIEEGAAKLLWPVLRLTFGQGEKACRAYVARDGLGPDLVEPGARYVAAHGGDIRYGRRLRGVTAVGARLEALDFGGAAEALDGGDVVVLALPPTVLSQILPEIPAPREARAIVNAHYRLDGPVPMPNDSRLLGLVGGTAHWLFARGDVASVTVSAADDLAEESADRLAALLWADVAKALDLPRAPQPPCRIVKERRATFAQIPAALSQRPPAETNYANLFLAGDWTDTGLPATIEGAVRSGQRAARLALAALR